MPTALENKIINFNNTYGTKLSINRIENASLKNLQYPDDTLFDKNSKNKALKKYVACLTQTLSEAIRAKIKINDQEGYDVAQINILSFIREFETIVKERKEETEYDGNRLPYEGADYKTLVKYVVGTTKEFDQALCWNWAESVINEKLSIKDMQAVTDRAISDLDSLKDGEEFGEEKFNKLANVYWAMKAMEMVRQQRGFFFRIFSFRINKREKQYFNQLVEAKDRFIKRGFPVAKLQQIGYASVMKTAYEDVEKGLNSHVQEDEKQIESVNQHRNLPKVAEQLQPRTQDLTLKNKAVDEIIEKLPLCRWEKSLQKPILLATMMNPLIKTAQETNELFDNGVSKGENMHHLMTYSVKMVYQKAFFFTGSLGYTDMDTKNRILAAQIMTDVIMKFYSPVALDNEKYAEFAEGYMFKDGEAFKEITELDSNENYFLDAKKDYDKMKRESIELTELSNSKNAQVVPPVQDGESKQLPIINKN